MSAAPVVSKPRHLFQYLTAVMGGLVADQQHGAPTSRGRTRQRPLFSSLEVGNGSIALVRFFKQRAFAPPFGG